MNTSQVNSLVHPEIPVKRLDFQTKIEGKQTDLYYLESQNRIRVAITNYGGRVVSLMIPDKNEDYADVSLGMKTINGYQKAKEPYYGALIGRVANRINEGTFSLDGTEYNLTQNSYSNSLHGGPQGFHNVVWDAYQHDSKNLKLTYISEDGEEGFPGRLRVEAKYSLTDELSLRVDLTARTDKATIVNLTNHTFFNLKGEANGSITDHILTIYADEYTPVNSRLIPTGEICSVRNTPLDFRLPTTIGERIEDRHLQLKLTNGYDHNYVLNKEKELSLAAKVHEPHSGRKMELYTTEPGMQLYTGNFLDGRDVGKFNKKLKFREAFCLEPQHYPDSPNQPNFPSIELRPGDIYKSTTIYKFKAE